MKIIVIISMIFVLQNRVALFSEWFSDFDRGDWIRELGFTVVTAIDWKQTKEFTAAGFTETNPILGRHPSGSEIDAYMGAAIIGHWFVAWLLPPEYRSAWQGVWIVIETVVIYHNEQCCSDHDRLSKKSEMQFSLRVLF